MRSQIIPNGAGTVVNPQGNQINITGGTQAGANLFHRFRDFNVNSAQIANFLSNPQIQNILARINGGNPSLINGLLQVTGGNSNLFLMNPAGIVFGQGASLNIPASFTATTANQIGFGNNLFNAFGDNNFSALIGNPDSFIFTTNQAGSIVNAGNLVVGNGQNISLIAGNTINTGRLSAPGGEIQVLAVPGTNRVRLSQPGQVLSLEIVPPVDGTLRAVDLPALLTGRDLPGIVVNPTGQVQVAGTTLPNQQGIAVASGRIDVSSTTGNGGTVQVMGDRVAVLNSRINANGATGGGTVRLGGEYLGGRDTGIAPAFRFNSQRTLVDRTSLIRANATISGEGGRVIVWADQNTGYFGRITGRGATGRGGFVEVSGRENLAFDGRVEIPGANGLFGTLLLDPTNITIQAAVGNGDGLISALDGDILSSDPPLNMTISAGALGTIATGTNINIVATNTINFQSTVNFSGNVAAPGAISFTAATITSGIFALNTSGRHLTMVADTINAPNLTINTISTFGGINFGNIQVIANTGNLNLAALRTDNILTTANAGSISLLAPQGNIVAGAIDTRSSSGSGGNVSLHAPQGNITINSIASQGTNPGNTSGSIDINAGNLVRVIGTCFAGVSLCSTGNVSASNPVVTIRHGGGITTPFIVGNSAINGTAATIDAGATNIPNQTIIVPPAIFTQGLVQIITTLPPPPVVLLPVLSLLQNPAPPPTPAPVIVGTPPAPEPSPVVMISVPSPSPLPSPSLFPSPTPSPTPSPIPSPLATPIINLSPSPNPSPSPLPSLSPRSIASPSPASRSSPNLPPSLLTTLGRVALNSPALLLNSITSSENIAIITNPSITEINLRLGSLENSFQDDFQQYLGVTLQNPSIGQQNAGASSQQGDIERLNQQTNAQYNLPETQIKLNQITETTRVQPALVYVFFAPENRSNNFNSANLAFQTNRAAGDNDTLEVIMITGKGEPVRVQFPKITRRQVIETANDFRSEVTNFRSARGFLNPAKQVYQWMIAPLETELQKRGIDNLVFLMDSGLRSIPLAALHDGKGFVIERYSVGLMPSLNLTPPTYNPLDGSQVLAMGATTFTSSGLSPLPAVSLELNTVSQLWQGSEFLNDRFTLDILIQQRQARPFRMIHLATHAVFSPGDRANSYIQLWGNERLTLDQIRQANLTTPLVDLLVLSACQTALGDRDAELGFAGLSITSGVRSAIASLWQVNDGGTMGLMTAFYQQLPKTTTKAEALRQAQLLMLRGEVRLEGGSLVTPQGIFPLPEELKRLGDKKLTHPFFWSAFTLIGNPW